MVRSEDGEIVVPERDIQSEAEACLAIIEPMLPYDPEGHGYAYKVEIISGYYSGRMEYLVLYRPTVPEPPEKRWWQRKQKQPLVAREVMSERIYWDADDPGSIPNGLEEAAARMNVRLVMKALPEVEQ